MPWADAAWEGGSPGRDPLFGCCAAFPSPSFCKSPILCPRSRSSHTQPSTCLGQAAELLAPLVPHPPGDALSSQPVFPSTPPTFSSHAQSHRQPCDTAGTLCGLLSFSPRQQGRVSKPRSGRAPRKEREGTKSRAPAQSPPSNGPASRPPLRAEGGRQPGIGRAPGPPVQALENGASRQGLLMVPADMRR